MIDNNLLKRIDKLLIKYEPILLEIDNSFRKEKEYLERTDPKYKSEMSFLEHIRSLQNEQDKNSLKNQKLDKYYKENDRNLEDNTFSTSEYLKLDNQDSRSIISINSSRNSLSQSIYSSNYNQFDINSTRSKSYEDDHNKINNNSQTYGDTDYDREDQKNNFNNIEEINKDDPYFFHINQAKKLENLSPIQKNFK